MTIIFDLVILVFLPGIYALVFLLRFNKISRRENVHINENSSAKTKYSFKVLIWLISTLIVITSMEAMEAIFFSIQIFSDFKSLDSVTVGNNSPLFSGFSGQCLQRAWYKSCRQESPGLFGIKTSNKQTLQIRRLISSSKTNISCIS